MCGGESRSADHYVMIHHLQLSLWLNFENKLQNRTESCVVHIVSRSFCSSLLVFQSFRLNNRFSCWHFLPENTTAETAMCFLLRATLQPQQKQQQQQPFCWHAEWLMPVVTFRWCWVAGCSAEETPTASTVVRFIIISLNPQLPVGENIYSARNFSPISSASIIKTLRTCWII